jgi:hypothetical protein
VLLRKPLVRRSIHTAAEVSSNPHPPEMARFRVEHYAMYGHVLFWAGLSFAALLLASHLKLPKLR